MSVYKGTNLLAGIATNTITNAHDLLDYKWTDHELNDMSWLRSNPFSYQSGDVYSEAYNHLVADYNSGTSQTETVEGYTISYVLAPDGHKITTDYSVVSLYGATGSCWYYVLDTTNKRFVLPYKRSTQIIRYVLGNDYWYRLYADGWVEQGGYFSSGGSGNTTVTLPVEMVFVDYFKPKATRISGASTTTNVNVWAREPTSTTQFVVYTSSDTGVVWEVSGPSGVNMNSFQADQKYLYFYVGQFSQTATEQTAGLNSELFNGKADVDLSNAAPNASASAKETIVGWGMPDYSAGISVTFPVSTNTFTAPSDGNYVLLFRKNVGSGTTIASYINGVKTPYGYYSGGTSDSDASTMTIPLSQGDEIYFDNTANPAAGSTFYPYKGVNNA